MRADALHPGVNHALALLRQHPQAIRIARIAQAAGLSERRLALLFRRQIGMTPKHYARLLRFRAVMAQAHEQTTVDWSALAADCGYGDQAHLSHEFRRFAGVSPSAFMASRGPHLNHLPLD